MKEFHLIEQYFTGRCRERSDVELSIGDDCALVSPAADKAIAISCDTLVEGVHFLSDMPAHALGFKSLAVNLSDLAAMGAEPAWMTLAITLPNVDEPWLKEYSSGLFEAADYYGVSLVGGDTTRGPRSFTITINGIVPKERALIRSGAKNGDWIFVTGTLGDAALGLDIIQGKRVVAEEHSEFLIKRHYYPTPRVSAGLALRGLASSAIDLSDGLTADIHHLMKQSQVGAVINIEQLPLSEAMLQSIDIDLAYQYASSGGEDYELLFTVPEAQKATLETALMSSGVRFTQIGQITTGETLKLVKDGQDFTQSTASFKHF